MRRQMLVSEFAAISRSVFPAKSFAEDAQQPVEPPVQLRKGPPRPFAPWHGRWAERGGDVSNRPVAPLSRAPTGAAAGLAGNEIPA